MAQNKTYHVVCTAVGVALIAGGVWSRWDTQRFLKNAVAADGTVTEITSYKKRKPSQTIYEPIVQFEDAAGTLVSFKGPEIGETEYLVGDDVEILYEKENPAAARINTFSSVWESALLLCGGGTLLVVKGTFCLVLAKVRK